jgi:hypothetical protein
MQAGNVPYHAVDHVLGNGDIMANLTEVYEHFDIRDREILVKIWNGYKTNKLSIATLPFVNAWEMKTVVNNFYDGISEDHTIVFPKGVTFKELLEKETHLIRTLAHACRKPKNGKPY